MGKNKKYIVRSLSNEEDMEFLSSEDGITNEKEALITAYMMHSKDISSLDISNKEKRDEVASKIIEGKVSLGLGDFAILPDRDYFIKKGIASAAETLDNPEYYLSSADYEVEEETAQSFLEKEDAVTEYESDFLLGNEPAFELDLYLDHINHINKILSGAGEDPLDEDEVLEAISSLKEDFNVNIDCDMTDGLLNEKYKMVISYSPEENFEYTFDGAEGVGFSENDEFYLSEDYNNYLSVLGVEKKDFTDWGNECIRESKKYDDADLSFFSKYSPGNPFHSVFAKENKVFHSIFEEIENNSGRPTEAVFLAKMSIAKAKELKEGGKITFSPDVTSGLFDNINGGGSVLGIVLPKEITLDFSQDKSKGVFDIHVDGQGSGYGVDSVYGLTSECWTEDFKVTPPEEKNESIYVKFVEEPNKEVLAVFMDNVKTLRDGEDHYMCFSFEDGMHSLAQKKYIENETTPIPPKDEDKYINMLKQIEGYSESNIVTQNKKTEEGIPSLMDEPEKNENISHLKR